MTNNRARYGVPEIDAAMGGMPASFRTGDGWSFLPQNLAWSVMLCDCEPDWTALCGAGSRRQASPRATSLLHTGYVLLRDDLADAARYATTGFEFAHAVGLPGSVEAFLDALDPDDRHEWVLSMLCTLIAQHDSLTSSGDVPRIAAIGDTLVAHLAVARAMHWSRSAAAADDEDWLALPDCVARDDLRDIQRKLFPGGDGLVVYRFDTIRHPMFRHDTWFE